MKITEIAVGSILNKDFEIVVDDHALDRARERGVDPRAVDYVIKKQLPKILPKIEKIQTGERFWIYDWSREVALGLRRISSAELKFVLKTVWPGMPARIPGIEKVIKT